MSLQSDAAKACIEKMLDSEYCNYQCGAFPGSTCLDMNCTRALASWQKEYQFAKPRRWAFDYTVSAILCAIPVAISFKSVTYSTSHRGVIEIDGGTFQKTRTGHSSGVGLRAWREKHNAAMSLGWRVWHYAPEEIIKAGRKYSGYPDKTQENPRDGYVNLAWAEWRNPAR